MKTLQHATLFFMALMNKYRNEQDALTVFREEVPWLLLPDGIRAYIGPRQAGHFEETPDGKGISWMVYPSEEVLKHLSKDNAKELVEWYVPEGAYSKCVIGEKTNVQMFDLKNWSHPHYHALRTHLLQDCVLDETLRTRLIDHSKRFQDEFALRHNPKRKIDGAELRKQVGLFEDIGFIKLVGAVYESTGVLLTQEWFDENVYKSLCAVYPRDLADNTYRFMKFPEKVTEHVKEKKFSLTDEEKSSVYMADDLEQILNEMYVLAYRYTFNEL